MDRRRAAAQSSQRFTDMIPLIPTITLQIKSCTFSTPLIPTTSTIHPNQSINLNPFHPPSPQNPTQRHPAGLPPPPNLPCRALLHAHGRLRQRGAFVCVNPNAVHALFLCEKMDGWGLVEGRHPKNTTKPKRPVFTPPSTQSTHHGRSALSRHHPINQLTTTQPITPSPQVVKSGDKPHFMGFDMTWLFDILKIGDYAEGK